MKDNKPKHGSQNKFEKYFAHKMSNDAVFKKKIENLIPEWFVKPVDVSKVHLLGQAKAGLPRPNTHTTAEGGRLTSYTSVKSSTYDSNFTKQIKELAPHWFVNTASENKKLLTEMVKKGVKRPVGKLGRLLTTYTCSSHGSFDKSFNDWIRDMRPEWFDTKNLNKSEIIRLAKTGEPFPHNLKHPLGKVYANYICETARTFDSEFKNTLKKIRPDWFEDKVSKNKEVIQNIAKQEGKKPQQGTVIGDALARYVAKKSKRYDSVFAEELKKLRPDWFNTETRRVHRLRHSLAQGLSKKTELKKCASLGESKPNWQSPLGRSLSVFTNITHRYYDPVFTNQIKQLAPHWFKQ